MYWLDGALYAQAKVPFALGDRGLTLGDGVFDTALMLDGRIFQAGAHRARLDAALAALGIDGAGEKISACVAALAAEGQRRGGRHALRVTVTRGAGLRGLAPAGAARPSVFGALAVHGAPAFAPGLRMDVATIRRNESSPGSRLKTLSYLDAILALRAAAAKGCDEALFLNTAGRVGCASVGNIFVLLGETLVTPPLADGVLPGIIRGFLLAQAGALGFDAQERSLSLDELGAADAVFMTNSLRLIAPVDAIGAVAIAARGARIVAALQDLLRRAVAAECGREP